MKIAAHYRPNDRNHESLTNLKLRHFGEALGAEFSPRGKPVKDADLVITSGFQRTNAIYDAMERGVPIIVLENPVWHYGDKSRTYTWAYNGLHGGGWVPDPVDLGKRPHPKLESWKAWDSGRITIFGQVPTDKAVRGHDIQRWVEDCRSVLPDTVFRPHPIMVPSRDWKDMEPFDECLANTSLAVTFTSTVGSETVIAGIPTIACHEGSLAYPVSSHSLSDTPVSPRRVAWIHGLSWRHWSTDEPLNTEYILGGYDEARSQAELGLYDNLSNGRSQPCPR